MWYAWERHATMCRAVVVAWEGSPLRDGHHVPSGLLQSAHSCKHGSAEQRACVGKLRAGRLAHAWGKGCSTWRATEGATWGEESRSGRIALSRVVTKR